MININLQTDLKNCPRCSKPTPAAKIGEKLYPVLCSLCMEFERAREETELKRQALAEKEYPMWKAGLAKSEFEIYFASLIIDSNNVKAIEAAKAFVSKPQGIFVLHGDAGRGKTHIAVAIVNEILLLKKPVKFIPVIEWLQELREAFNNREFDGLTDKDFQQLPLLVLDDLGAEKNSEFVEEKVFELIHYRHRHELGTIITTNLNGNEISKRYGERVASRMLDAERGVHVQLGGIDRRLKKIKAEAK